jgi:hypothetical protein
MRVKLSESHASRVNDDAPVESDAPVLLSKISTSSIHAARCAGLSTEFTMLSENEDSCHTPLAWQRNFVFIIAPLSLVVRLRCR